MTLFAQAGEVAGVPGAVWLCDVCFSGVRSGNFAGIRAAAGLRVMSKGGTTDEAWRAEEAAEFRANLFNIAYVLRQT